MPCEKFERRLHQLLDERLRPADDAQLRRHADLCPACRQTLAAQVALAEVLARSEPPQPSAGFVDAVVLAVEHELRTTAGSEAVRGGRRVRRPPQRWGAWLTAAVVLLAVAPAAHRALRTGVEPAPQAGTSPLATSNTSPVPAPRTAEEAALVAAQAGVNVQEADFDPDLALGTTSAAAEERYAMLLDRLQAQIPALGDQLGLTDADAPTVQGAAAVSQITHRLRTPITSSLHSTLNVLRTALPTTVAQPPAKPQAGRFTLPEDRAVV